MKPVAAANEEATEAWSGVLFDRYVEFRDQIVEGVVAHGRAAMDLYPPTPGSRVLDIGCGFGDTTQELLARVAPAGEAVGVDVAPRFIETATAEAEEAGIGNIEFVCGDLQTMELEGPFDYAFSRIGVMFFDNPVVAWRNLRSALKPGARFVSVVWRRKLDNPWVHRAEEVVEKYLEEPEETDEPTCGPGPFAMANADTVSEQLKIAGFEDPTFTRLDLPMKIGGNLDQAVAFNLGLGPAAEVVRLAKDDAEQIRAQLEREIREALADLETPDGVFADTSVWIISARAPDA